MSDWKTRATPVTAEALPVAPEGGADWRARAAPVEAPTAPSDRTSTGGALLRGFGQGLTFNFGDELGAGEQALLARVAKKWPGLGDALGIETRYADELDAGDVYRDARSDNREQLALDEREHGKAALVGSLAGGLVLAPLSPGGAAANATRAAQYGRAALTGAGFGALGGVGASNADLTEGEYGTAALHGLGGAVLGAGLGAAGHALGQGVVAGIGRLRGLAQRGVERADELATATAQRTVGDTLNTLRGEAGAAASRAGNTIRNIDEIALGVTSPERNVGYLRQSLARQLEALTEDATEARARAVAAGLDPDNLGVGRVGEFLSRGSGLDQAQRAAARIQAYEQAAEGLRGRLAQLEGVADDVLLPDPTAALQARQAAVRTDPGFLDLKENVLGNALDALGGHADDAIARRAVLAQAQAARPAAEALARERLLSGAAATERLGHLARRYGPPLAGSLAGTAMGASTGSLVGAGVGMLAGGGLAAAAGGLAGAGMRPAVQAILRSTAYPPVLNAASQGLARVTAPAVENAAETVVRPLLWRTAHALATRPEVFGPFAAGLAKAIQGGDDALAAEHARLSATSPDYQARMRALAAEDEWN